MLVISRKTKDCNNKKCEFRVGDAKIVILSVDGQTVKIGIDAPKDTLVLREELVCNSIGETICSE